MDLLVETFIKILFFNDAWQKKRAKKNDVQSCSAPPEGCCFCKGLLAILIVVLVWVSQATWSKWVITVAVALILLGSSGCACRDKAMKKK